MENNLKFQFSVDQVNVIMEALSRMPYAQVFQLIAELQKQAQSQLGDGTRTMAPPSPVR